jgi:type III pantothenate kinase
MSVIAKQAHARYNHHEVRMMLLAIDCGNTNIVLGVFDNDKLLASWRLYTDARKTGDEYLILLKELFCTVGLSLNKIDGIIIDSVVPGVNVALRKMTETYLSCPPPLFVDYTTPTGIKLMVDNPAELGSDRIVNALAAYQKYGGNLIIVDFGTATTFDCVSATGEYLGGAICPGIEISREALFAHAAKLSNVVLRRPPKVIATNTEDYLRSGILWGYGGQVDALVRRMSDEWGVKPKVIATGGFADLIAGYSDLIDLVDIDLTLEGLRVIWEKLK